MARERIDTYEIGFEGNLDPLRKAYTDATSIGARAANAMQTSANSMARSAVPANQAFSAMGKIAEISGSSVARYARNVSELGSQLLEMGSAVRTAGSLGAAVLPGIGLAITAIGAAVGYWISQNNKVREQQEAIAAKAKEAAQAEQDKLKAMREQVAVSAGLQKAASGEEASLKKQQAAFDAMKGQPERAAAAAAALEAARMKTSGAPFSDIRADLMGKRAASADKITKLEADRNAAIEAERSIPREMFRPFSGAGNKLPETGELASVTEKRKRLTESDAALNAELETARSQAKFDDAQALKAAIGVTVRAGVGGLKDLVGSTGGLFPKFADITKLEKRDRSSARIDDALDVLPSTRRGGSLYDLADFRGMAPVQAPSGASEDEKTNKNLETIKQILERIERRGGGMR